MNNFVLVGADTDSIAISDGQPWNEERRKEFLAALNACYPELIRWEDDGVYERFLVLKAKNYVLDSNGKRTTRGSALKATLKEPALRDFINEVIEALITKHPEQVTEIYHKYVKEILHLQDIKRWASKKTITESVLHPGRTNEEKVLEALAGTEYALGDKKYFYFKVDGSIGLSEKWNNDHCASTLLKKLYNTLKVFESVYDYKLCPNYSLKKNQKTLQEINNVS